LLVELQDVYCLSVLIRKIKSWRITWMKHVVHIGEKRNAFHMFMGKPEGRNYLEDLCMEGRILFKMNHKEMGCKDVDCVFLAEVGDHW
jgi:hypothetical protein